MDKKYFWKSLRMFLILFLTGGLVYVGMECAYRGYSHWTMFIVGGICYLEVGYLNEFIPWEVPLFTQSLIGACLITLTEFLSGCIINLWLGWGVWDYSNLPCNVLGQVCLPFFVIWIFVAALCILVNDWQRYQAGMGDRPHYHLFKLPPACEMKKEEIIHTIIQNWKNRHVDRKKYLC